MYGSLSESSAQRLFQRRDMRALTVIPIPDTLEAYRRVGWLFWIVVVPRDIPCQHPKVIGNNSELWVR